MRADPVVAEPLSARELAAFVAAVETGSVRGAAEALSLTQSAATKRLQALERRLGTLLLRRSRTGVRPTDAGRRLYPEARHALAALVRAERAARPAGPPRRVLTLAASHTIGEVLLPEWLAAYRLVDPELQMQADVVNSPAVIRRVRDGSVSIGFVEGVDDLGGLESMVVARDELVAVVGAHHRWSAKRSLLARELAGEPYVAREAESGTRAVAESALEARGVELRPSLELASLQSVKRALASGGVAVISAATIEEERRTGVLHALRVRDAALKRDLHAIRRRRPAAAGPARGFWRWLQQQRAG